MNFLFKTIQKKFSHKQGLVKVLENISWLSFDKIFRLGLGLVITVLMIRYLGPESFGKLSFAIAFISFFGTTASLGLPTLVVREVLSDPASKNEILGSAAILHFVASSLSYLFAIITIIFFQSEIDDIKHLVIILGLAILFKPFDVIAYWFESQIKSKYIVISQGISALAFSAIKLLLIINSAHTLIFAWAIIFESLLSSLILVCICNKYKLGLNLKYLKFSIYRIKKLLADCWPLLLTSIAVMIYLKIDQVMIGAMINNEAVGVYSAAIKISEIWYFIPSMIVVSFYPIIIQSKKKNEDYHTQFQHLFDVMALLSFFVIIIIVLFSDLMVIVLFGESYRAASSILSMHTFSGLFVCFGVVSSTWLVIENRQMLNLKRTLLGAISNIIFNLLLIPEYGINGAAIATVISYGVATMFVDILYKETRPIFFMQIKALNLVKAFTRVKARLSI